MKLKYIKLSTDFVLLFLTNFCLFAQIPMEKVLNRITIASKNGTRGLVDTIGFAHTEEQMNFIGKLCEKLEKENIIKNQKKYNLSEQTGIIAGVSPHDDYIISGRVYTNVIRFIKAKTIVLIGNSHWSQTFGVHDKLIFGNFKNWTGPYSPVKVSPLRDEIIKILPEESFIVKNKIIETEHSLEALIPFLQYYNKNFEIIPILIPVMTWESMNKLGRELSSAFKNIITGKNLKLGTDIAFLISTDGVHYGDYGWSYYGYYPFGTDAEGYIKATKQDHELIADFLTGQLKSEKIHKFFSKCVNQKNVYEYKITWCGRFSVSFGLNFLSILMKDLNRKPLNGFLLRYGTSIAFPTLPVEKFGLGLTGPTNLHHFVSHVAIGYK
ncbi:AmmeMemoRadiSam system protein B [candidate division KSB1 bacterium]|nr:MAG: AmmeMemoRadiSam system protein B [candidate division KSB1 bacterium]